ncbi:MAG: type II/IV secretion system protein, partial [Akkermansiaceae bacterium]|nr:type II/IV secretion system protein [Akkermansiaceae bacterium]
IDQMTIGEEVFEAVPVDVARRFRAIPLQDDGTYMTVAVADALDFDILDTLPHVVGREVNFVAATPTAISKRLHEAYGVDEEEGEGESFTVIGSEGEERVDANDA